MSKMSVRTDLRDGLKSCRIMGEFNLKTKAIIVDCENGQTIFSNTIFCDFPLSAGRIYPLDVPIVIGISIQGPQWSSKKP